jgi:hypothetical protein
MKKISLIIGFVAVVILLTSCALQKGLVKYEGKQNEIVATQNIKDFMSKDKNPSIVLRVPNTERQATQSDPNNYIYNAIEKELVMAGFDVKDRGLFNEVINKSANFDYDKIKELTGTELILELVRLQTDIRHTTNRIYKKNGKEKFSKKGTTVTRLGAVVEFKLIIIENNDFGGSYSFYYTPCSETTNDCNCSVGYRRNKIFPNVNMCITKKKKNTDAFEVIDQNVLESFVRVGVKQMINEIRK